MYDIHQLDNLLTYAGENCSVVLAKVTDTNKYPNDWVVTGAIDLQLEVNKTLMGSLTGKSTALGESMMMGRKVKNFVCFVSGENNYITNSWFDIIEYNNGKIIMPDNYSQKEMSVDEFVTLLEACPKYKSN